MVLTEAALRDCARNQADRTPDGEPGRIGQALAFAAGPARTGSLNFRRMPLGAYPY
jgi:hypothetical protein